MRKKSISLLLAIFVLLISTSPFLVNGYIAEIDLRDTASYVTDKTTFVVSSGAKIKLADIVGYDNSTNYLRNTIEGLEVYLDIDNKGITAATDELLSVVYIVSKNDSSVYINLNKALVDANYARIENKANDFSPYLWTTNVFKTTVWNNTIGIEPAEFEDMRKELMGIYSSQTITHVGYVLALIIGLLTFLSRWDTIRDFFSKRGLKNLDLIIVYLVFVLTLFFLARIIYWSTLTDRATIVVPSDLKLTDGYTYINEIERAAIDKFDTSNLLNNLALLTEEYGLLLIVIPASVVSFLWFISAARSFSKKKR